ncbi:MAG: hypothetical protein RLZZ08_1311 [Pseudomonadota bacterium]|jgi:FKBP-type peptidyl-prolyl cis-trans isomerase
MKPIVIPAILIAAAATLSAVAYAQDRTPDAFLKAQQQALTERAAQPGWTALPGGVLWRRIKGNGKGTHPTAEDTVEVNYEASLVDGTVVDSSFERGESATFPLQGLIPAWTMAIPEAGEGDTIEIAAPSDYAYGDYRTGPIPGGSTLLFKVELIAVVGR